MFIYVCKHACMHKSARINRLRLFQRTSSSEAAGMNIYMHIYSHIHTHTHRLGIISMHLCSRRTGWTPLRVPRLWTNWGQCFLRCVCVCMYTCLWRRVVWSHWGPMCVYLCICMCACMSVCVCVCVFVHIYIYLYIYIYIYI